MRAHPLLLCLVLLAGGCGGGGGGNDPPGPPPKPFAELVDLGLAIGNGFSQAAALGPILLVPVSEIESGADLNGDGDQLDRVLHRVDADQDTATNLGFAITGRIVVSDRHFAFLVSEPDQGGTDLNGDGDASDGVWFVYDPALPLGPGNPQNTGWATPATGLAGAGTRGGFVLLRAEGASGADLNGDGDLLDEMAQTFDGGTFAPGLLSVGPVVPGAPLVARNGRVLVLISEPNAGADLNGDGDPLDAVLGAVDFNPGLPIFLPVGGGGGRAVAGHPYALTDTAAVYFIDEASHGGIDLNADGDAADAIVAVFDIGGGSGEILPLGGGIPAFAVAGAPGFGLATTADRAVFALSEAANGARDLNGDMDTVDAVLGWVDTTGLAAATLHLHPLALGPLPFAAGGHRALFAVSETGMGAVQGVDLNGDTDTSDNVAHALDMTGGGIVVNLGLAVGSFQVAGADALLGVSEAAQGGGDLNGDSDAVDTVLRYLDLGRFPPNQRGLAMVSSAVTLLRPAADDARIAAILPEGQSPNFGDLNGDGDQTDTALVLTILDPSLDPPGITAPTPFAGGTASLLPLPPIFLGPDRIAFASSEALAGADLNGDGDQLDTLLVYLHVLPPDNG